MDVAEVFVSGLEVFGGVLEHVGEQDWDRPSPCQGWDARAVTGHVLTVLDSATTLLQGGSFDWTTAAEPAVVAAHDPLGLFRERSAAARAAVDGTDLTEVMQTPMGPMPKARRLAFGAMDLHLHAWDLGRAVAVPVEIPAEVAAFVHGVLDHMPPEMVRSARVFGPERAAPADATPTEVLMAWTGRQVR